MIHQGDCLEILRTLPDESVHCCVTSPPYWGLRDYGVDGQLGLEKSPEEYVARMVDVFREVRRVLRADGTLWLNIGDSYAGPKGNTAMTGGKTDADRGIAMYGNIQNAWGKPKDLVGIPWRLAFALQSDGWYLRQDIIWHKPNPMPESVRDRCTKAHEYVFLMSKSARYYWDAGAVKEESSDPEGSAKRYRSAFFVGDKHESGGYSSNGATHTGGIKSFDGTRNRRSVWTVATQPCKEAHFAVMPQKLVEPCILAGCPEGGTVLDPFFGAGTVGLVATKLGRKYVGIELNPAYIAIARKRIGQESGRMPLLANA